MAMTRYLSLTSRGLLALPADLRRRRGLDRPGAQVAVVERDDGVIELHPAVPVPAEQAWFWSERWQRMEAEVDEHVERGEIDRHNSGDAFLEHLDRARDSSG
jgi:hypothetical protein